MISTRWDSDMAWIQSHQTIAGHPKTRKLAHMLGISKPAAIGHLHCFWWWALDYADDGDLADLDALDIAIGAEWDGDPDTFFNAMVFVGFIDSDEVGDARIHDWHDYAGKLVDRRKANAERMRQARANDINERASHVQRTQRARVEPEKSRQDKSREEGANAPSAGDPAPKPTKYTTDFETFWKAYPTGHGVKKSAFEQWRKIASAERQAVMDGLEAWKRCDRWQRGFVKEAQTWLKNRQWEDEPPASPPGSLHTINTGPIDDGIPDRIIGPERRRLVREKWMRDNPEEAAAFIRDNPERARELGMTG